MPCLYITVYTDTNIFVSSRKESFVFCQCITLSPISLSPSPSPPLSLPLVTCFSLFFSLCYMLHVFIFRMSSIRDLSLRGVVLLPWQMPVLMTMVANFSLHWTVLMNSTRNTPYLERSVSFCFCRKCLRPSLKDCLFRVTRPTV